MAPSNWNDEKIISSLKELPKIEDRRSKELLFQKVYEEVNQTRDLKKRRKYPIRILPSLATAAVFAILLLIVPSMFQGGLDTNTGPNTADEAQTRTKMFSKIEEPNGDYIGSLQEIQVDQDLLTMYYSDDQTLRLIPVSIPIEKGANKLEAIKKVLDTFPAAEYGLAESAIKGLNFIEEEDPTIVQVQIPEGHLRGFGSTEENLLIDTVNRTLADLGYKKAHYMTEGMPGGVQFPNRGQLEYADLESPEKEGFIPYITSTGDIFLYSEDFSNEEAIDVTSIGESLQQSEAGVTGSPLLSNPPFSIQKVGDSKLVVKFKGELKDNDVGLSIIDSILLTANNFGYTKVSFEGVSAEQIGSYHFDAPVSVPLGPNKIELNLSEDPSANESNAGK